MVALLDVNVLLALVDRIHVYHELAYRWFDIHHAAGWATCPITENGAIRILSQPRYPNSVESPAVAADILAELVTLPGHAFWPDSISLLNDPNLMMARLAAPGQVTDAYLVALAKKRGGRLVTLDRKLVTVPVVGVDNLVEVIS